MKRGEKLSVNADSARKAKEFKGKLKRDYSKRTKPKKNNAPNVKSELRNWMRKQEYVKVVKRSMNKGVFVDYIPIICQNLYNYDHHFCGQRN